MNALLAWRVDTKQHKSLVPLCWAMHAPLSYLCRVYVDLGFKLQEKLLCIHRKFTASVFITLH